MLMITIPVPGGQDTRTTNKLSLIEELGERGTFSLKEEKHRLLEQGKYRSRRKRLASRWPMDTGPHRLF